MLTQTQPESFTRRKIKKSSNETFPICCFGGHKIYDLNERIIGDKFKVEEILKNIRL